MEREGHAIDRSQAGSPEAGPGGASADDKRHPIGVAVKRTELSADLIRIWERRYGVVTPKRCPRGRRLYSDLDLHRLFLLRRATEGGRAIGEVVTFDDRQLEILVAEDDETMAPAARACAGWDERREACLRAVDAWRADVLLAELRAASVRLGVLPLLVHFVTPLMREIGRRWSVGELGTAQEHMATAAVRSWLGSQIRTQLDAQARIVVTTTAGQHHEIGALMAAAAASHVGWQVIYLGPDLPANEIVLAVEAVGADQLALGITFENEGLDDELARLRSGLGSMTISAGGRAIPQLRPMLQTHRIESINDISAFAATLRESVSDG